MLCSIMIADAYPIMSEGVEKILSKLSNINKIFVCHTYKHLQKSLLEEKPDILLLHSTLDTIDEYVLLQEIRLRHSDLKILLISGTTRPAEIRKLYKAQINGFLLRTAKQEELVAAVTAIINDQIYVQEEIKTMLVSYSLNIGKVRTCNASLTRREKEVLQLIVKENTTKEIANSLFISPNTVETHRLKLIQKLGVRNTAGLVREAIIKQLID